MLLKIFFCFIFGFIIQGSSAQIDSNKTNLFEYGDSILSCEDNLKNFFINFPKYIDDNQMIKLIDNEYVGNIKNRKQARRYVKVNFKAPPFGVQYSSPNESIIHHHPDGSVNKSAQYRESGSYDNKSVIRLFPDETIDKNILLKKADSYADEFVKTGYHVYAIKFAYQLDIFTYYIFINPDHKKVVTYANIFGFDIPVEHFTLHDNRSE